MRLFKLNHQYIFLIILYLKGVEDGMSCTVTSSNGGLSSATFQTAGEFVVLNTVADEVLSISCTGKAICAQFSTTSNFHTAKSIISIFVWKS